ncbi:hypothetical protein EJ06DRAFT_11388 [Trichodelitschia bisporula]|uniref:Uncharacterized protein n=1 Tax=Trichodelitschia bisporula TaxID=703511 RepID=A0A6G1I9T8_9PEZI|nr:hypothetical protein EJ06DRAFT_11388 [Trichodelitschia bisporula]
MSRWSDFMAYQWQADAVQQALDPQGLKAVLQSDVVNGQSQDTIKYALQLTDQIIQYWDSGAEHKPARFTLEQNPEAFHALIACPNGRGVAWLLTQHKETFGVREIWAIDVFHVLEEGVGEEGSEWKVERDPKDPNGYDMNNNNQLEMLFYIRPVQGTPLSQPGSPGAESPAAEPPSQPGSPGVEPPAAEPPSQPRSPGVQSPAAEPPSQPGSPGVQSPAAEPPSSLPFKSDSEDRALGLQRAKSRRSVQVVEKPTFWQEFVCKGDRYIAMMAAPDLATAGTASGHGNVASAYPNLDDATIINSGWTINTFGADIDLRLSGYEAMCKAIGLRPEFAYGVSYIYGDLEKGYFTNVVSQGTIFAEANLSPSNKGPQLASTSLPQRWADFVHHQWMNDATQQALDPRGLNYVLQDGVMNVQTRDCLIYAMQQTGQAIKFWTPGKPPPVWFTLTDTPEPFKALLASPNGRGAAWLLTQHKDTFGVREIWGITAFHALKYDFLEPDPYDREGMDMNRWDNSLQILFHIRPVAPRDSVQQVRSRRSVQVIPEPPWWVDYVCQGAKFMAMMAAPDLATAAKVGGRDSVESDYPDLDEKTILDIGWAINTMAATINLELPGFKPMLQKLGLKAKKVTGETFQRKANVSWPTRAYFMNAIYQGMLIGLNNQSPATLPQAAGSPPALRQSWSDFVHYQWKKDKDQQALDPKGLKYVLRHHVINERTRDAVQYAMQQTKQVVQYWNRGGSPARLTPEDTPEEFKAMLATPNGHGIPWLLTQHKDTFGVREVYAIEIFHVYEALFNGDEPPSDDPMGRDFTEEWLNKLEILFYIREVSSPGAPAKAPAKAPADVQLKAKL